MKILLTGGAGFIGSHTAVALIENGFEPIIVDDFRNSEPFVIKNIEKIVGKKITSYSSDIGNKEEVKNILQKENPIGVIHFAAFLIVNESVTNPLKYYNNNIISTLNLLEVMLQFKVKPLVFSSSCTVYGNPDDLPVNEHAPIQPAVSPYGNTKKMCEDILKDTALANDIEVISLRYFNPIGAHESSIIGEFQDGPPHHLVPYITETARGLRNELRIFGGDWNTKDGTCVRDYIHVVDVAKAHISAVDRMINNKISEKFEVYNLGMGVGVSVLEMVNAFEEATGIKIKYDITDRREGDVEAVYADTTKANQTLNWKTEKTLTDAMRDAWNWEKELMNNSN